MNELASVSVPVCLHLPACLRLRASTCVPVSACLIMNAETRVLRTSDYQSINCAELFVSLCTFDLDRVDPASLNGGRSPSFVRSFVRGGA